MTTPPSRDACVGSDDYLIGSEMDRNGEDSLLIS